MRLIFSGHFPPVRQIRMLRKGAIPMRSCPLFCFCTEDEQVRNAGTEMACSNDNSDAVSNWEDTKGSKAQQNGFQYGGRKSR